MSKQYGLGFLVLDLYLIIFLTDKRWKAIGYYLLGYLLPILLCCLAWGNAFVESVFLNGYGSEAAAQTYSLAYKVDKMVGQLVYFLVHVCPCVLVSLLFLPLSYKSKRLSIMIFAYCGVGGFIFQQFFSGGGLHYMMPLVPFAVITLAEIMTLPTDSWLKYVKYLTLVLMVSLSLYKVYYNRVDKLYVKRNDKLKQEQLAADVKKFLKPDDVLFIIHTGVYYVYFYIDNLPPNLKTIGYSFGPLGISESQCGDQIRAANYVLRFTEDYPYEAFFTDSMKHVLEQYPIVGQFQDSTVVLHKIQ